MRQVGKGFGGSSVRAPVSRLTSTYGVHLRSARGNGCRMARHGDSVDKNQGLFQGRHPYASCPGADARSTEAANPHIISLESSSSGLSRTGLKSTKSELVPKLFHEAKLTIYDTFNNTDIFAN